MFQAKVTGKEACAHPHRMFARCPKCRGRGRSPYQVDLRGSAAKAGAVTGIPFDFDFSYDTLIEDPPDRRSDMIRVLDAMDWRDALAVANVTAKHAAELERKRDIDNPMRAMPYLLDIPKLKCPMIRLLDDPAWRESLAAAETPLSGLYRKEYGPFFGGFFW